MNVDESVALSGRQFLRVRDFRSLSCSDLSVEVRHHGCLVFGDGLQTNELEILLVKAISDGNTLSAVMSGDVLLVIVRNVIVKDLVRSYSRSSSDRGLLLSTISSMRKFRACAC